MFKLLKSNFYRNAVLAFFLMQISCFAQDLKFKNIGVNEGLSVGAVETILEDTRGLIWIGTDDGLNLYNGYDIKVFKNNPKNPNTIASNYVDYLLEGNDHRIWIATADGGLSCYNLVLNSFENYKASPNGLLSNKVNCLAKDKDGNIYIGSDLGLQKYDIKTKKFETISSSKLKPNKLSNNEVQSLLFTKSGKLLIGTNNGINALLPNSTFQSALYKDESLDSKETEELVEFRNQIKAIHQDANGTIWVGTYGGGFGIYDESENRLGQFLIIPGTDNQYNPNRIKTIASEKADEVWLASSGNGLIQYNYVTRNFKIHQRIENNSSSLASNDLNCILIDSKSNVWCGTQGLGISILFEGLNRFKHFKRESNEVLLNSNSVMTMLVDKDNYLWIGSYDGDLNVVDLNTNKRLNYNFKSNDFNPSSVYCLFEDAFGHIWIGSNGTGVLEFNKSTNSKKKYFFGDHFGGTVTKIFQDKRKNIWVCTYDGGLAMMPYKNGSYSGEFKIITSVRTAIVFNIYQDSKNQIWVASGDDGLYVLDEDANLVAHYNHSQKQNTIISNIINAVYEDKFKNIWVATTNGLDLFEEKTKSFKHYNDLDGLPNNYIYGILEDKKGNLWLTTNKGVSTFNPDLKKKIEFKNFDVKDGLQGREFNQGSFFKAKNGDFYIGGENGFNVFNPENLFLKSFAPKVYISSYKRFGTEVVLDTVISAKKDIELSYKDNFFSFDFIATDYLDPNKNMFSYIMEGVDAKWSVPSNIRYASYTQLGGGDYTFKVKAANSDGVWSEPVVLHITVIPPWWKTKWFYTISILLILGGVFAFIRIRTAQITKEKRVLEEKVEERTHELAQKNKDITASIEYAKRIQMAMLPANELIARLLPNSFILYKPKDIVSGDFYWFGEKNGLKILGIIDCTGHGVPGAFMSMIGHNLLNQIVLEKDISDPGTILTMLHQGVQSALKQGNNTIQTADGMDVSLVAINTETRQIKYAGAFRTLMIINNSGELEKIEGNKFPIGGAQLDMDRTFTTHIKQLAKGDTIYMSTDGYADQFGGDKGKKFMVKRFHEYLTTIHEFNMDHQKQLLNENIENWRGTYEQVDDILVGAVRL